MTLMILLSLNKSWICASICGSFISFFPTLGTSLLILSMNMVLVSSSCWVCFPSSLLRLDWNCTFSSSLFGTSGVLPNRRPGSCWLVTRIGSEGPASAVSPANTCAFGLKLLLWQQILAMVLANLRGYLAVNWVRVIDLPFTMVLPAMGSCSWSCWHVLPWRLSNMSFEFVMMPRLFFMSLLLTGSRSSPMLHMSHWARFDSWCTSWRYGSFSINDLAGCSQWKNFWRLLCIRNRTMHNATWSSMLTLSLWHQALQGPHSGLTHTCSGSYWFKVLYNTSRPAAVWRSPSSRLCRMAWFPKARTWWVNGLSLEQNTSSSVIFSVAWGCSSDT